MWKQKKCNAYFCFLSLLEPIAASLSDDGCGSSGSVNSERTESSNETKLSLSKSASKYMLRTQPSTSNEFPSCVLARFVQKNRDFCWQIFFDLHKPSNTNSARTKTSSFCTKHCEDPRKSPVPTGGEWSGSQTACRVQFHTSTHTRPLCCLFS